MDTIESFISSFIVKIVQKSAPNLSADDMTKINKAVADFTATAMDLAGVYLAIRSTSATAK